MIPTKQQLLDAFAWTKDEAGNVEPSTHLHKFLVQTSIMADAARWHMERLGLGDCEPKRILDLGCAVGMLATACRMAGHEVVAVNAREKITEIANKYLPVPNLFWHVNYGEALPDWGKFDLVIMHGVDFAEGGQPWDADHYAWLWRQFIGMLKPDGFIDVFKNRGEDLGWFTDRVTWVSRGFRVRVSDNVVQIRKGD